MGMQRASIQAPATFGCTLAAAETSAPAGEGGAEDRGSLAAQVLAGDTPRSGVPEGWGVVLPGSWEGVHGRRERWRDAAGVVGDTDWDMTGVSGLAKSGAESGYAVDTAAPGLGRRRTGRELAEGYWRGENMATMGDGAYP